MLSLLPHTVILAFVLFYLMHEKSLKFSPVDALKKSVTVDERQLGQQYFQPKKRNESLGTRLQCFRARLSFRYFIFFFNYFRQYSCLRGNKLITNFLFLSSQFIIFSKRLANEGRKNIFSCFVFIICLFEFLVTVTI